MFCWYWLSDLCLAEKVPLVVGHAYYMRLIHGAKAKNDRIDAHKIARLLRGGNFPLSYVYPRGMRETRDLLRRRTFLVRQRAGLMTHLQILNAQYNLPPLPKKLSFAANRAEMDIPARFSDPSVQRSAAADLAVIDCLDGQIAELELHLTRAAKVDDVQTYHRLRTIPGVGPVLALILLYEIHDIRRFASCGQFLSYARLVRCAHESDGKALGSGGDKIGNAQLRWALGEAACLFLRSSDRAKRWKEKQTRKRGEGKALAVLAARLGRAVYHLWRKGEAFDEGRFWGAASKKKTGSFSVGGGGGQPCRSLICARPGGRSAWAGCSACSAGGRANAGASRCAGRARCTARRLPGAGRSRRSWRGVCGSALSAGRRATPWTCGPRRPARGCTRRSSTCTTDSARASRGWALPQLQPQ
jgi:transposase